MLRARLRLLQRTVLERSLRSGVLVPLLATFGLSIVIQNLLLESFSPDVRSLGGSGDARDGELADHQPALDLGDSAALDARRRGRDPRRAAAVPLADAGSGARCARPRRIPTPPSSSASTRARSTRGRRRSRSRPPRSPGCSSRCARPSTPTAGPTQLIFAFEAVVIGGLGSLWGTLVGGIVLGVAQTIGARSTRSGSCSRATWCSSPCSACAVSATGRGRAAGCVRRWACADDRSAEIRASSAGRALSAAFGDRRRRRRRWRWPLAR